VDVAFPRDSIPNVYEALQLKDVDLTLEVQQQLGDGVVRTIAMAPPRGSSAADGKSHRRANFGTRGQSYARPDHGRTGQAAGQPR